MQKTLLPDTLVKRTFAPLEKQSFINMKSNYCQEHQLYYWFNTVTKIGCCGLCKVGEPAIRRNNMTWEEQKGEIFTFEKKGDQLIGIYKGSHPAKFGNAYDFEVDNSIQTVFGSAILEARLKNAKEGDKVKIVYDGEGEAKEGQKPVKLFKVFIDR